MIFHHSPNKAVQWRGMQGVELEIDFADVLHLIQQFCLENNLLSSFQALQTESNVSYSAISSVQDLMHNIQTGKWGLVLAQFEPLSLFADGQVDLYEQIVLELIEEREVQLARSILRGSKAMNLLRERDGERYLRLEYLVPPQSALDKDEIRKKLAKKIVNEISTISYNNFWQVDFIAEDCGTARTARNREGSSEGWR